VKQHRCDLRPDRMIRIGVQPAFPGLPLSARPREGSLIEDLALFDRKFGGAHSKKPQPVTPTVVSASVIQHIPRER
jgi:hypothetical protein